MHIQIGSIVQFHNLENPGEIHDYGEVVDIIFIPRQARHGLTITSHVRFHGKERTFLSMENDKYWQLRKVDPLFPELLQYDHDSSRYGIRILAKLPEVKLKQPA